MDGTWRAMAEAFRVKELPVPPVPTALRPHLQESGRWCWATRRTSGFDMYYFDAPANPVFDGDTSEYVAVSHAGQGASSFAVNYFLVYRQLALFAQVGWGGAYMDGAAADAAVVDLFTRCRILVDLVEEAPGDPASPWRLVCLSSDFRHVSAAGWSRIPRPPSGPGDRFVDTARVEKGSPLEAAEHLLRAGPPTP